MKLVISLIGAAVISGVCLSFAQAAPPLEIYGALPTLENVEISPDGKRIAFVGPVNGVRSLNVREIDGPMIASTPLGKVKLRDVSWAGNDLVLLRNSYTGKSIFLEDPRDEFTEVVAIDLKHKSSFSMAQKSEDLKPTAGIYGVRQVNGHWYGFFGGWDTKVSNYRDVYRTYYPDVFRVDLESGEVVQQTRNEERTSGYLIGEDGQILARGRYNAEQGAWQLFINGSKTPALTRQDKFGASRVRGLGRDANTVIVGPGDGDEGVYVEVKTDGSNAVTPLNLPDDVRNLLSTRSHIG